LVHSSRLPVGSNQLGAVQTGLDFSDIAQTVNRTTAERS
jgi:hypothetical protein